MTNNIDSIPYIYVACEDSCNQLEWYSVEIDASQSIEHISDEIWNMLDESPSQYSDGNWFIYDYANFCGIDDLLGTTPKIEVVNRVAKFIVDTQDIRENCKCFDYYYDSLVKYTKRAIKEFEGSNSIMNNEEWEGDVLDDREGWFAEIIDAPSNGGCVEMEDFKTYFATKLAAEVNCDEEIMSKFKS